MNSSQVRTSSSVANLASTDAFRNRCEDLNWQFISLTFFADYFVRKGWLTDKLADIHALGKKLLNHTPSANQLLNHSGIKLKGGFHTSANSMHRSSRPYFAADTLLATKRRITETADAIIMTTRIAIISDCRLSFNEGRTSVQNPCARCNVTIITWRQQRFNK